MRNNPQAPGQGKTKTKRKIKAMARADSMRRKWAQVRRFHMLNEIKLTKN